MCVCVQVALDKSNKLFVTNFKLTSAPRDLNLYPDLELLVSGHSSVGLLHCNNMASGSSYYRFVNALQQYHELLKGING